MAVRLGDRSLEVRAYSGWVLEFTNLRRHFQLGLLFVVLLAFEHHDVLLLLLHALSLLLLVTPHVELVLELNVFHLTLLELPLLTTDHLVLAHLLLKVFPVVNLVDLCVLLLKLLELEQLVLHLLIFLVVNALLLFSLHVLRSKNVFEVILEDLQLPLIGLVESSVEPVLFFGLTPDV